MSEPIMVPMDNNRDNDNSENNNMNNIDDGVNNTNGGIINTISGADVGADVGTDVGADVEGDVVVDVGADVEINNTNGEINNTDVGADVVAVGRINNTIGGADMGTDVGVDVGAVVGINNTNGGAVVGINNTNGGVDVVADVGPNVGITNTNGGINNTNVGDDVGTVVGINNTNGEINNSNVGANVGINNTNGGVDVIADVESNVEITNTNGGINNTNVEADVGVGVGDYVRINNTNIGANVRINNTNVGAEELDSSGNTVSDNHEEALGNNQDPPRKKKRYNRHSQFQIQSMEIFFSECPHPDDKQRKELSRQLGLDPIQVKFWFQNKRTQHKNHQERFENTELRTLNDKLRAENQQYREAIFQALCPKCGGQTAIGDMSFEEHHLRIQNARLREEINQLSALAERFTIKPVMNSPVIMPPPIHRPQPIEFGVGSTGRDLNGNGGNLSREITGPTDAEKPMIIELAVEAMEELLLMAQVGEPLWLGGVNDTSLALNLDEYTRTFRKGLGPRLSGFRTEASRETGLVAMNPTGIVEMLMQVNLWSTMFVGIIGRAMTHGKIVAEGDGNFNGALQIISAEYQVLSPQVSTRESYFVRYCKQKGDGLWAVVDVSIDHLVPNIHLKCRRRPSGCLIQEIPSGFSKVTWVEHVEVDDREGDYNIFRHLICTGQAFGANRWVAILERQCERIASLLATDFQSVDSGDHHITLTNHGKMSILKLAERIARTFFVGLTNSMGSPFSGVAGDDIRVMTMKSLNDPGMPPGVILSAATSFWVPVPPKTVFDFLRDENNRNKWDFLCTGGIVQKISEIANGRDSRNCATLLRNANTCQSKMMIIQETSTDPTASFVIYAPVDTGALEAVLNGGGDPDYVALLPSGFAILPDGMDQPGGGSLLTVGFQMLVEAAPLGKLSISSVATVENLIRTTVMRIKALFPYQIA